MMQACKAARNIVQQSLLLQYKVACFVGGAVSNPSYVGMDTKELLDRLQAWHHAWCTLSWTGTSRISFPRAAFNPADRFSGSKVSVKGSVLSVRSDDNRSITFSILPSLLRGISAKTWTIEDAGFVIEGFTHDYGQDLLVLEECRSVIYSFFICTLSKRDLRHSLFKRVTTTVHFLTLSTSEPHPQATQKSVSFTSSTDLNVWHQRMAQMIYLDVLEDLLIMVLTTLDEAEIWTLNWKQNRALMVSPDNFVFRASGTSSLSNSDRSVTEHLCYRACGGRINSVRHA